MAKAPPPRTGRGFARLRAGSAQYQWLACQNDQASQGLPYRLSM